jgi:3-mercaptopyruvate sulfurtransferase SseA
MEMVFVVVDIESVMGGVYALCFVDGRSSDFFCELVEFVLDAISQGTVPTATQRSFNMGPHVMDHLRGERTSGCSRAT